MKLSAGPFRIQLLPLCKVDSEDWVRVRVIVSAIGFEGDFEAWLQLGDLYRFENEINAMYLAVGQAVSAVLACAEPDIWLRLKMQTLGGVLGDYRFTSAFLADTPTALSGGFEMDQSFLPALQTSVHELADALK